MDNECGICSCSWVESRETEGGWRLIYTGGAELTLKWSSNKKEKGLTLIEDKKVKI